MRLLDCYTRSVRRASGLVLVGNPYLGTTSELAVIRPGTRTELSQRGFGRRIIAPLFQF